MSKFGITITYMENRYLELEAESEAEAEDMVQSRLDDAEPLGDDDYEFEIEEIDD